MSDPVDCREAGRWMPVVSSARCEGKEDCVRVCPYDVFTVRRLSEAERKQLSLLTRFKVWAHGGKQAFVTNPEDCHGCTLCVRACPETAIQLRASQQR